MVEGARLESVYRLIAYRGFESLVLRHHSELLINRFQNSEDKIQTQTLATV